MGREINTVDLFCGAGGASTGLEIALKRKKMRHKGLAINHWSVAVDTMKANHPDIDTKRMSIEEAVPADLVPCGEVDLLWASPSCFTAGHLVTTSEGQKPIEAVKVGDTVLTHKGRWRKVIRTIHRNGADTVIAKGAGHYGIETTASHKFWLRPSELEYKGKNRRAIRTYGIPQWMRIDRALANEALWATPYAMERLPIPDMPSSLAALSRPWWVLGRWLGDGWLGSGRHYDVSICCCHEQADELEKILSGSYRWSRFKKRTVTNFTLTNREAMEWIKRHFGHKSYGKMIPSWCLTMPESDRRELLEGYLSADGNRRQRRHTVNTVSRALAVSVRLLCEGLGHRVGMTLDKARPYHIDGRTGPCRVQYRLHYEATLSQDRAKEAFVEDGCVWGRVKKVSASRRNCTVYNIEVEEDHSYVIDGIVVKNCTHHSRAKGGKPRSNQLRAQPELVLTWLDQLFVRRVIIENVPEFVEWGPLNKEGKPIKRLKGACFQTWVKAIEARNYIVEWRIVNCADYGDATSRRRFFLKAVRKGCGKIHWPEPTHAENPQPDLFGKELKKWRGVRECLDLSDTGRSIFNREKPLAQNTLRRIMVGLRKFNGLDFQMDMLGSNCGDENRVRLLSSPLPTQQAGGNRSAVVRPFVVKLRGGQDVDSVDAPISAIATSGGHHMICQPLVVDFLKNGKAKPANEPIGSQHCNDRFGVVTPYLITEQANNAPRGIDKPLRAQTTVRKDYLCTPLVMGQHGGATAKPIDEPCPTIATGGAVRVITPLVLDMSRPGGCDSGHIRPADKPIQTLTTCDNVQGVFPILEDGRLIDIRIRMLKPSELAKAHSFPDDYHLTGNRGEQVKQIGNSVPVMTAAAMCEADFKEVS